MTSSPERSMKFVKAESRDLKTAIYKLRYRVYVEECGFERPEDHPNGLEVDAYDASAIHFAALNHAGNLIGTCRIVLPSAKGLPMEQVTSIRQNDMKVPLTNIAEISRLAVSADYRRRIEDGLYGMESYGEVKNKPVLRDSQILHLSERGIESYGDMKNKPALRDSQILLLAERRRQPVTVLGMYRLLYQESKRLGLTHWYMIAEKKLWYLLHRYHLCFHQIGAPVNYHGIRIPYMGVIEEIEEYLQHTNPDFFKTFMVGLEEQYYPKSAFQLLAKRPA